MLAVLIINHGTAAATQGCLDALAGQLPAGARVHVLDNGSAAEDVERLSEAVATHATRVTLSLSLKNLGFAGGMNLLLRQALADSAVDQVLLLNSDTAPKAGFIAAMQARLDPAAQAHMVAANMRNPRADAVDSLGITLYRSTLASNRKREDEILLGPSGGCALFSANLTLANASSLARLSISPNCSLLSFPSRVSCARSRVIGSSSRYFSSSSFVRELAGSDIE